MRVHILALGRLNKAAPEAALVADYLKRFDRTGRGLGLGPAVLREIDDRKASTPSAEADLVAKAMPSGALCVALDERGAVETSPQFAHRLADWRDLGTSDLAFCIGGADGFAPGFRNEAAHLLSFGPMVWPHMLARVMLAEQLYRAAAILAGTPYHRA